MSLPPTSVVANDSKSVDDEAGSAKKSKREQQRHKLELLRQKREAIAAKTTSRTRQRELKVLKKRRRDAEADAKQSEDQPNRSQPSKAMLPSPQWTFTTKKRWQIKRGM